VRQLNILHVTWSGDLAGMLTDIVSVQRHDADLRIQVCFGTRGKGFFYEKIEKMGIPVIHLGMTKKYALLSNIAGGIRLRSFISEDKFDIIHFQEAMLAFPFLAAALNRRGTKIIVHNRGEFHLSDQSYQWIGQQIKKVAYRFLVGPLVHTIIANSYFTAQKTPLFGIYRKKILVIHNAINHSIIDSIKARRDSIGNRLRRELNIPSEKVILTTVARLVRVKRVDRFIRVIKRLTESHSNIISLVVGDGPLMPELSKLTTNLRCNKNIRFLGWREDAKEIISASDIFILPSCGEAFGISAIEAICLNVPTFVFADGGGVTKVIKQMKNGFVAKDEDDMCEKITSLLGDQKLLNERTNSNYKGSLDFDINNYVKKIKDIYLSCPRFKKL
jgi:glycosyltransferase involved in cell wall biosynthesis